MAKENVMPAGSQPPESTNDKGTTGTTSEDDKSKSSKEELLGGKFKSPEEMAKSYERLELKLGQNKSEIGNLRNQVSSMEADAANARPTEPPKDFGEAKELIQSQIEDGELSVADGVAQLTSLAQEETAFQMEEKFSAYDEKRDADDKFSSFINGNPDFLEMEQGGLLEEEIQANPMHDKFSAYFAVKARLDADKAFEAGREEALKISRGADGTRSVLSKPGSNSRDAVIAPKKGMGDADKVNGMLSALQGARGQ